MSAPTLEVTCDFTKKFNEAISRFKQDAVLVGIPQGDKPREDGDPINNATLLAIANFGSPANNIPAWPIMGIGIKNAQENIAAQFRLCAQTVLSKGPAALATYYERAGIIASNSIKKVINDQDGVPDGKPEASTLKGRKYLTKAGFKGTKYWVVTGQMRNAITYVVKNIWAK